MTNEEKKNIKELMVRGSGAGLEDFEAQDLATPWLVLVQAMSPQLIESHELYNPEARPGRILNTQSGAVFKEVHVIPCRYTFRTVEWKPRSSGGGFVASYNREEARALQIDTDNLTGRQYHNGNELQQTSNYLCIVQEEKWTPVIIVMKSTQLKKAKRWNSMIMSGGTDIYSCMYRLGVVSESNNKGTYFGWQIQPVGKVEDEELFMRAKDTCERMVNFLPERTISAMKAVASDDDEGAL